MKNGWREKLLSCDSSLTILPDGLPGLEQASCRLDDLRSSHTECFWNTPARAILANDRLFVAIMIQAIKKQGKMRMMRMLPELIEILETGKITGDNPCSFQSSFPSSM